MPHNSTPVTSEAVADLTADHQPPCLSLYQPTHRRLPDNQQDPIRFRNLIKKLESLLRTTYPSADTRLLEPYEALSRDQGFWSHTLDGLAVMAAPGFSRVFVLQRSVPELVLVSDSFHVTPLRRFLQTVGRYQVLALNLSEIQLFEGNRDALDELEPAPGVPRTLIGTLGEQLTEQHITVASYGGAGQAGMHHGHVVKNDEVEIDAERFFRAVDRGVLEHHSRPSGLPLILAALPEHQSVFRRVSHNPFLLDEGVAIHPDALPVDELRERAWKVVEPQYQTQLETLIDDFAAARPKGRGSDHLSEVAKAAAAARIATLLIEADRQIPGRLDPSTGHIEPADPSHRGVDNFLDDLAEQVWRTGGQVVVVPAEQMPVRTGAAAIYRY